MDAAEVPRTAVHTLTERKKLRSLYIRKKPVGIHEGGCTSCPSMKRRRAFSDFYREDHVEGRGTKAESTSKGQDERFDVAYNGVFYYSLIRINRFVHLHFLYIDEIKQIFIFEQSFFALQTKVPYAKNRLC